MLSYCQNRCKELPQNPLAPGSPKMQYYKESGLAVTRNYCTVHREKQREGGRRWEDSLGVQVTPRSLRSREILLRPLQIPRPFSIQGDRNTTIVLAPGTPSFSPPPLRRYTTRLAAPEPHRLPHGNSLFSHQQLRPQPSSIRPGWDLC